MRRKKEMKIFINTILITSLFIIGTSGKNSSNISLCTLNKSRWESGLYEHLVLSSFNSSTGIYLNEITVALMDKDEEECLVNIGDSAESVQISKLQAFNPSSLDTWQMTRYLHYRGVFKIKRISKKGFLNIGQYFLNFNYGENRTVFVIHDEKSKLNASSFEGPEIRLDLNKAFRTCVEYHLIKESPVDNVDYGDVEWLACGAIDFNHKQRNLLVPNTCNVTLHRESTNNKNITYGRNSNNNNISETMDEENEYQAHMWVNTKLNKDEISHLNKKNNGSNSDIVKNKRGFALRCSAANVHHGHGAGHVVQIDFDVLVDNEVSSWSWLALASLSLMLISALSLARYLRRRRPIAKLPHMPISLANQVLFIDPEMRARGSITSEETLLLDSLWPEWVLKSDLMRFPRSDISFDESKPLGSGNYGFVYNGKVKYGTASFDVAVKQARDESCESQDELLREAQKLASLSDHPNIVNLKGITLERGPDGLCRKYSLILTLYTSGNLEGYLKRHKESLGLPKDLLKFKNWAHQIANGMCFLAEKEIIHMDLATRNVLLTHPEEIAKISDFGLSRFQHEATANAQQRSQALPLQWLPPEVWLSRTRSNSLSHRTISTWTDVWSFGVLLWEIFSIGAKPYAQELKSYQPPKKLLRQLSTQDRLGSFLESGNRLRSPFKHGFAATKEASVLYDIMCRCWDLEPNLRPTFLELRDAFQQLMAPHTFSEERRREQSELAKYTRLGEVAENHEYLALTSH